MLIIGAGISGIGAAYRIHEKNPELSYTVLERRERIGGTWDLFRYPGIRSDSDIFTLSFPYEPWTRPENVADGPDIREYLTETARKHGIDEHIRFNTHVLSADWDSTTDTWTVQTEQDGAPKTYRGRFLFFGTGYYNYDEPYRPEFPGIEEFAGEVVHPAALAGVAGLHRQAGRGDRQRRDRGQHDPVADREGRARDDAAALADLHVVDAAHPPGGAGDPKSAAAHGRQRRQFGCTTRCFTVLTYVRRAQGAAGSAGG